MKSSFDLGKNLPEQFKRILAFDQDEIDNPDPYRPSCRDYMDRIEKIIEVVEMVAASGSTVAEIGAAQGNMSLLLAERNYRVSAVDISPTFLEYSKMKYERGEIEWIQSNLEDFKPQIPFDVIILAEVIEHCAWPEKIVAKVYGFLKPGGTLIVTTPNADRIFRRLPTFSKFDTEDKRRELEKRQFGPDGDNHLFLFTMDEMKSLLPPGALLRECGYLAGNLALNGLTYHFFRLIPLRAYRGMIRRMASIPFLNRFCSHNIYMAIQKPL